MARFIVRQRRAESERGYLRPIARRVEPVSLSTLSLVSRLSPLATLLGQLRELEDRRTFHPEGRLRPARASFRSATQLVPRPGRRAALATRASVLVPSRVAFKVPNRVAICVRRKSRREVLFAKRVAGAGGGRFRKRRYNEYSFVGC